MKKIIGFLFAAILLSISTFALEVDEPELRGTSTEQIEFINYTGPHKVIDSIAAIKAIGSTMGETIVPGQPSTVGNRQKYFVVHAIDPTETSKLDADILFIGENATVDHIINLRRIISAYLSAAYKYSEKDADTLAVFITVYNAVYRGKYDVFSSKYKNVVMKNLSQNNCGLSTTYKEWPGRSEIVIPLFDVNGGLSTVDTSVISDTTVVESMKEDEDKNVDPRKDMVDLKEREAEDASEKAQEAQKKAVEEDKKLTETKKEAEEAKKEAEENPTEENIKKAEEKEKEVKEQEKKTEEAKEEAKEQQEIADKKQNEAQEERKEIAKDQKEVQDKEAAIAKMGSEYGIILSDEANMLSRLVKFNVADGEIIKKSPVTEIRNRTVYKTGNQYMAVAGENTGNGTIKLVLLDDNNMEIVSESNETLAEDSVLVQEGDAYYCVIQDGNNWVVAKYNSSLVMQLKSPVAVKSSTPITITESGLVVTAKNGQLRLLSKADLTSITKEAAVDAK
jgi:flagellar biosynthesis GTPase FlhF